MLDLTKGLPLTIDVGGESFPVNTDYRLWIKFGRFIQKSIYDLSEEEYNVLFEILMLKKGTEITINRLQEFLPALIEFYICREVTPRSINNEDDGNTILSFDYDGSYIYASFRQAYNINLLTEKLHWHEFNALIKSLPNNTKISEIMGFRSYTKSSQSMESQYQKSKEVWTIPDMQGMNLEQYEEYKKEILEEIKNEFYGCI